MAHEFPLVVWAVWTRDHIHTDIDQRLAVFSTKKDAADWVKKYGGKAIKKFVIADPSRLEMLEKAEKFWLAGA